MASFTHTRDGINLVFLNYSVHVFFGSGVIVSEFDRCGSVIRT